MVELTLRERLETVLVRGLLSLPPAIVRRLVGPAIELDGRTLDLQVQLVLRARNLARPRGAAVLSVAEKRRDIDVAGNQLGPAPPVEMASVEAATVGGRPARIYTPRDLQLPAPALVWFHGGGFVVGSLDSHDGACRQLARATPCVVIAVDYRLAPEHPFPAAADDATRAFRDVVGRADELGIDPRRVAVGGDSAGGNLAMVVAVDTRADEIRPRAQLAIYPATDFTRALPSHQTFARGFFLEEEDIVFYEQTYLAGTDPKDPRASPLFTEDVSGLPPAVIVTAGFDPLRDEGDAWVERVRQAGGEVTHLSPPNLFHGFWNCAGAIDAAARAFLDSAAALRAYL